LVHRWGCIVLRRRLHVADHWWGDLVNCGRGPVASHRLLGRYRRRGSVASNRLLRHGVVRGGQLVLGRRVGLSIVRLGWHLLVSLSRGGLRLNLILPFLLGLGSLSLVGRCHRRCCVWSRSIHRRGRDRCRG